MNDRVERWLIETDQLEALLNDADARRNLRIFDCSTRLAPDANATYRVEACREEWLEAHLPDAGFVDIQNDLSKPHHSLRFTWPDEADFAAAAGRLGIDDSSRVVLYSRHHPMWATRVWWMLRAFGFENAAILNGGIEKWSAEGRPVEAGETGYPRGNFTAHFHPARVADRERVLQALNGDHHAVVLNALSRDQHAGKGGASYGRPGRIAGSVNVPAREMTDGSNHTFRPMDELRQLLAEAGADGSTPLVTYCGGGIAATVPAFVMALLGHDEVALYDNSLSEWCMDPALPMETD